MVGGDLGAQWASDLIDWAALPFFLVYTDEETKTDQAEQGQSFFLSLSIMHVPDDVHPLLRAGGARGSSFYSYKTASIQD